MTFLFFQVILLTIFLCFHKLVLIRSIVVLYSFFVIETSIQDLYEKLNWQYLKPSQSSVLVDQWIIHIGTLQNSYFSHLSFISKLMHHLQWVQLWLRLSTSGLDSNIYGLLQSKGAFGIFTITLVKIVTIIW